MYTSVPLGVTAIHGLSAQLLPAAASGVDHVAPGSVDFENTIVFAFIHAAYTAPDDVVSITGSYCQATPVQLQIGFSGAQVCPPFEEMRTSIWGSGHRLHVIPNRLYIA